MKKTSFILLVLLLLLALFGTGQTNSFVTEYYLSQNFTPKSGITPGTNNTLWMSCDQILARYNVAISGTTTTGNRWPSQNQLTAAVPIVTLLSIGSVQSDRFTANGEVSNCTGFTITSRGVCWSTSPNPIIGGYTFTGSGSGCGTYSVTPISGTLNIQPSTFYYARAYVQVTGIGTIYSNQLTFTTAPPCLAIGDSYLGGKVAYIFAPGDYGFVSGECHGIVVYGSDLADKAWGCSGTYTSTTEDVGYAYENTSYIATASCGANSAAKACYDFFIVGEQQNHQWALPTLGDLRKIYENRSALGSFVSDYYWSSSSNDSDVAKSISFTSGANGYINKTTVDKVRPIRYF